MLNPDAMNRLRMLASAGAAAFYMNAQEGQELSAHGLIQAHPEQVDPTDPTKVRVSLTDAGTQYLASQAQQPVKEAKGPVVSEVRTGLSIPEPAKRGGANNLAPRQSQYPFGELPEPTTDAQGNPVYASFHVAVTDDNKEPWKSMASNVSAAKKRSEVEIKDGAGNVVMETVTKKTLIKGEDKKPLLDANGKRQYSESQVTQPKTEATKNFIARRVNKDDPDGEGVRVFRVPLDF